MTKNKIRFSIMMNFLGYAVDYDSSIIVTFAQIKQPYFSRSKKANQNMYNANGDLEFVLIDTDDNEYDKGVEVASNGVVKTLDGKSIFEGMQDIKEAYMKKDPIVTKPYHILYNNTEKSVVGMIFPIVSGDDKVIGVLGALIDMDILSQKVFNPKHALYKNSERFLANRYGSLVLYPDLNMLGEPISKVIGSKAAQEIMSLEYHPESGAKDNSEIIEMKSKTGNKGLASVFKFEIWDNVVW